MFGGVYFGEAYFGEIVPAAVAGHIAISSAPQAMIRIVSRTQAALAYRDDTPNGPDKNHPKASADRRQNNAASPELTTVIGGKRPDPGRHMKRQGH